MYYIILLQIEVNKGVIHVVDQQECQKPISTSTIDSYFPVVPRPSDDDDHMVDTLKEMFPTVNNDIIREAAQESLTIEDAVESKLAQSKPVQKGKYPLPHVDLMKGVVK